MHCTKCGNKLEGGVKFCGKCGNIVGQTNNNISNNSTPKEVTKSKSVLVGIVSILAFIVAFVGVRYLTQEGINSISKNNTTSKQDIINQAVLEVRANTSFPSELDEVTTWTGITGTSNAIRYQYILHNIDESQVSNSLLKDMLDRSICQNANTRNIIDADINMEYSYSVQDSTQTFFVSISKDDCL